MRKPYMHSATLWIFRKFAENRLGETFGQDREQRKKV